MPNHKKPNGPVEAVPTSADVAPTPAEAPAVEAAPVAREPYGVLKTVKRIRRIMGGHHDTTLATRLMLTSEALSSNPPKVCPACFQPTCEVWG